ncbi:glycosyltransferase family 2 protein [Enterobacter sichuanensis]|nr:glycosyltransferase family 2 protein [Enterobacter sichuanensis]MBY6353692.1 glycosyltransferase family 2 protein [Enterobacter sichuanensis]
MSDITLSIIIPCYNVESYIKECLDSVFIQLDVKTEVIIVNDGSTDCTKNIIKSLCAGKKNIKVINQLNAGLSGARNAGLKIAQGEYIAFLDGDDVLYPEYISEVSNAILEFRPDIIEIDAYRFTKESTEAFNLCSYSGQKLINKKMDLMPVFEFNQWYVWGRIYSKKIISFEYFEDGRRYEDIMFTPYLYLKAKVIYSINKPLIGYRHTPNSITKSVKECDYLDIIYALQKFKKYTNKQVDTDIKILLLNSRVRTFSYLKFISNNVYGYFRTLEQTKLIANDILNDNSSVDVKYRIKRSKLLTIRYYRMSSTFSWLKKKLNTIFN